ncbi:unnamed protein product [Symbiodinium sp. CCMP2592]|nr:unnamed protein product [Symbiodinium sp. CCMP2592]
MGVPSIFADVGWCPRVSHCWCPGAADAEEQASVASGAFFAGTRDWGAGFQGGCLPFVCQELYTSILEANDYQERRVTELCKLNNVEDDCNAKLVARLLTTLGLRIPTSAETKAALENVASDRKLLGKKCSDAAREAWAKTEGDLHRALMSHVMDRSRRNSDTRTGSKNMGLLKKLVNTLQEEKDQERKIPVEDPNRLPTREWGDFSEGSGPAEYLDDEDMADHAQEGGEEEEMDNDAIIPDPDDPTGFPKTPCKPHAPPTPVDSDTEAAAAEEALGEEAEKNADAQKDCFGAVGSVLIVLWQVQQRIRNAATLSEVQTDEAVQGRGNPRGRGRGRRGRGRGRGLARGSKDDQAVKAEDDDLDAEDEKATNEVLLEEAEDKPKNKAKAKAKGQAKKEPKAKAKGQAKKEPRAQEKVETPASVEEDCLWLAMSSFTNKLESKPTSSRHASESRRSVPTRRTNKNNL